MKFKELLSLFMTIIGVCSVIAGSWLIWDLLVTILYWVKPEFWTEFKFYLPFFIATANTWSMPFDLGLSLIGIGVILSVVGAYLVGYLRE